MSTSAAIWPTAIDRDEHAWLLTDSDDALAWLSDQDAAARAEIDGWPESATVRRLVEALRPPDRPMAGSVRQGHLSVGQSDEGPGARLDLTDPDGAMRTLLDLGPTARQVGSRLGIDYLVPSPTGEHLAVGYGPAGAEESTLCVIDLRDGVVAPMRDPYAGRTVVAWRPDGRSLLYSAGAGPASKTMQRCVREWRVGDADPRDVDVELHGRLWVHPQIAHDRDVIIVSSGNFLGRPWYVRLHDDPAGRWQPFLVDDPADAIRGEFVGSTYVAVHLEGHSLGRVVEIDPATPGRDAWRVVLDQSDVALRGIRHLGGRRALVVGLRDGVRVGQVLDLDTGAIVELARPGPGVTGYPVPELAQYMPPVAPDAPRPAHVNIGHAASDRSPIQFRADLQDGSIEAITEPAIRVDGIRRRRLHVEVSDGEQVTVDVVEREDLAQDTPLPTLVFAYGGFDSTGERGFDPLGLALVLSGGRLVLPHLRGGGERGWPWWHAGRRERKQRTFDDLYDVVDALVGRGIIDGDRVAVHGLSNGGLLAAVAATQRPQRWAAVGVLVPVTDLRRITLDPWGEFRCVPEYGDPDDPRDAAWMAAYSPYHAVRHGVDYPPTIVVTARHDRRTPDWHGRIFTAAMLDAGAPVRQLSLDDVGHFAPMDGPELWRWLAFYLHHLGLAPTEPDDAQIHRQSAPS